VRLHHIEQQKRDIDEQDKMKEEQPSNFHIVKARKRQEMRTITSVNDKNGNTQESNASIMRTFTEILKRKYDGIQVDQIRIGNTIHKTVPNTANISLEAIVTMHKLQIAIQNGKQHKAPGGDGICHEFYKETWDIKHDILEVIRQMHTEGIIMPQQKHGIVVCIPKKPIPTRPQDYRAKTLLNTDLKLIARIIANRLRPWLTDLLHPSQHCGVQGKTMLDAIATVREATAYAESTKHCASYHWISKLPSTIYPIQS
jgi:hypothetical protein